MTDQELSITVSATTVCPKCSAQQGEQCKGAIRICGEIRFPHAIRRYEWLMVQKDREQQYVPAPALPLLV